MLKHRVVGGFQSALKRLRHGFPEQLSGIGVEERLDGDPRGGVAVREAAHSISNHGYESAMFDERAIVEIGEAEGVLLVAAGADVLRVIGNESDHSGYVSVSNGTRTSLLVPT